MKTILIPEKKYTGKVKELADALLVGVESLSVNFTYTYTVEEIRIFLEENADKEIFIALNKNILNTELSSLEGVLEKIKGMPITGILYYDVAVLHLIQKKKITIPLYWAQEHFTTNYATLEYYVKEGVTGAFVSSDITKEEIFEMRKNTKSKLIVPIFGYLPLFVSRRHLIENYKKTFDLKDKSSHYYFEKEGKKYPIVEDKNGVCAFSHFILNGLGIIPELKEKQVDYVLINGLLLKENLIQNVLEGIDKIDQTNAADIEKEISSLCKAPVDTGFLYKETIYRVKKQVKK